MTTLFHRCKGKGPMVLALKDTTDAVSLNPESFDTDLKYTSVIEEGASTREVMRAAI
jgi:hypothetical protein